MRNLSFSVCKIIFIISALLISCSHDEVRIPLSTLDLSKMEQGYGRPHTDISVTNAPMKIAGRSFATGVGTHATSRIDIDPGNRPLRFTAFVGVDDAALTRRGSISFIVSADDKVLWESGIMKPGDSIDDCWSVKETSKDSTLLGAPPEQGYRS